MHSTITNVEFGSLADDFAQFTPMTAFGGNGSTPV